MWDLPAGEDRRVFAGDPDVPVRRAFFAHHETDERRLPGPRRAHEEHELTFVDVEIDIFEGHDTTVVDLRNILETDHEIPIAAALSYPTRQREIRLPATPI